MKKSWQCEYFTKHILNTTEHNKHISELENLLINCKYLDGLVINTGALYKSDFNHLFEILTKSSPNSLYKFKFSYIWTLKLDILELFFNNWKNRHPILLQTTPRDKFYTDIQQEISNKYKEKGIIKMYDINLNYDDFEWIQKIWWLIIALLKKFI